MDSVKVIDSYINMSDWRVKENSNNGFAYPSLKSNIAGHAISDYCLKTMYAGRIAEAHKEAAIHIHDLSNGFAAYCMGLNLRDLLMNGLNGVKGKVSSAAPRNLRTACLQMANLVGCVQMEVSGAIAFNSVDTLLAPYVRKMYEEDDSYWIHYETKSGKLDSQLDYARLYTDVEKCIEELVFNLNMPSRAGEIPFSNVSFDINIPASLAKQSPMIGTEVMDYTYGDLQNEANLILKAYLNVMFKGDSIGRIFPFPIPTFSVGKAFDWDSEIAELIFKLTAKYGTPYFQNFINSDLNPDDVRSMCCRLSLDLTELRRSGSVFNAFDSTGSIGVVTINLPQLAKFDRPLVRLAELLEIACESLEIKRAKIEELWEQNLFPYIQSILPHKLSRHFSTIGICGMSEFLEQLGIKPGSLDSRGMVFDVINLIKGKIKEFQQKTGHLYNFEETPAESACYRFAKKDGFGYHFYTQGAKLPFDYTDDLFDKLDYEEEILKEYTGGSVLHMFMGETAYNSKAVAALIKNVLTNYKVPYITFTPTFSICQEHGYHCGEHFQCPDCGKECEVYSRVVGYHAPVGRWNSGKQEEYKVRRVFKNS